MDGSLSCVGLPTAHDKIDVKRIELCQPGAAPCAFRGDQRGATSSKWIKNVGASTRAIFNCVGDQRHRLNGRMHFRRFSLPRTDRADTGIFPNVRSIASALPKSEIVDMRRVTDFENENML